MRDRETTRLLECLDFNGEHCGDVVAAAYFRQAAMAIRLIDGSDARARQELYALRTENAKLRKALHQCNHERDELTKDAQP